MTYCQSSTKVFGVKGEKRWRQSAKLLVSSLARIKSTRLSANMVYPFRRAGEKLKTVAKMDTWARGQSEEQTTATKPSDRCYLLELPTELLLEIISHLSVIPETCLALTCKRLFAISGAIFRSVRYRNCLVSFYPGIKVRFANLDPSGSAKILHLYSIITETDTTSSPPDGNSSTY
jgi:hypothetical protein